jgi:hypothetical protein
MEELKKQVVEIYVKVMKLYNHMFVNLFFLFL